MIDSSRSQRYSAPGNDDWQFLLSPNPTVKPRPPDDLALQWLEDAVRVTCPALPHPNLDYVIQHRGPGDTEWVVSGDVVPA